MYKSANMFIIMHSNCLNY